MTNMWHVCVLGGDLRHICVSVAGVNNICVCVLGGDLAAIQEPEGLTAGARLCLVNLVSLYFNHISLIFDFIYEFFRAFGRCCLY